MSIDLAADGISPGVLAELQKAAKRAGGGILDREEARKAAADSDHIREENRKRFGEQAIGVSIIREFRGPLP
jgi:hypothetical protein